MEGVEPLPLSDTIFLTRLNCYEPYCRDSSAVLPDFLQADI